jgi:hypothetical protein
MPRIIELRAPWMNEAAAARLLEQIEAFPQKWRSGTLGRKLNLTGAEWRILRAPAGAVGADPSIGRDAQVALELAVGEVPGLAGLEQKRHANPNGRDSAA